MSDKAYVVFLRGQTEGESYLLSDVCPTEFMGFSCIKGTFRVTTPSTAVHYMANRNIYIPVEKVLMVMEYESIEDYRSSVKKHYEAKSE